MIIDGVEFDDGRELESQICIAGGGVAGIVLAIELSRIGISVVVIESGGETYEQRSQDLYAPAEVPPGGFPDPSYTRLRFLGGASNHWENNTSPFDPIDFEYRSWVANSGWPISFHDLASYYGKAGEYCGVGQDGYESFYWKKELGHKDLFENSSSLETGIAKAAIPATRFFEKYKALMQGSAVKVIINSNLVDVTFDPLSEQVTKAKFKTLEGNAFYVKAETFVLCMGGIENARMLRFLNRTYGDRLGNKTDLVGRYFMDHPTIRGALFYAHSPASFDFYRSNIRDGRNVLGFMKISDSALRKYQTNNIRMPFIEASNYAISDGISSHHIMADALSEGNIPDDLAKHLVNYVADFDMVLEAISRRAFGKKIFDHADQFGAFQLAMMIEQTPDPNNRIKLSDDLDELGIPKIEIEWKLSESDRDMVWRSLEIAGAGVAELGLGRLRSLRERQDRLFGDQMGFGHHHMGTTRMAENDRTGVVDINQKVFGTKNLYIAGSSVFSTGGHVPPTLTIVATTLRLVDHLAKESRYES